MPSSVLEALRRFGSSSRSRLQGAHQGPQGASVPPRLHSVRAVLPVFKAWKPNFRARRSARSLEAEAHLRPLFIFGGFLRAEGGAATPREGSADRDGDQTETRKDPSMVGHPNPYGLR